MLESRKSGCFALGRGPDRLAAFAVLAAVLTGCVPAAAGEGPARSRAPRAPVRGASPPAGDANPMVHRQGRRLVDGRGRPVRLRGVHVLGWLIWEGTLWNAGFKSETTLRNELVAMVGREEFDRFRSAMNREFFNEADVRRIAGMGFNAVRISFNHSILEDEAASGGEPEGWPLLDRAVDWCAKHGVHVVLALTSAPGGESPVFVADPDARLLWADERNKERTVALWRAIAARYRDRKIVAGYELLNEPWPPRAGDLLDMYRRIIAAIREVDPHHLVILQGTGFATDLSLFAEPPDPNVAYAFHSYNLFGKDRTRKQLGTAVELAAKQEMPLLNTEFGANTADWTRRTVELFEDQAAGVSGWTFWPWKRVPSSRPDRYRGLTYVRSPPSFEKVRNALRSSRSRRPSREEALRGLGDFVEAVKVGNVTVDELTLGALTRRGHSPSARPKQPRD